VSRRGATPLCARDRLVACAAVAPRRGDALVFPHGAHPGCHPGLLHEGSAVLRGEKLLIRTDVLYSATATRKRAQAAPQPAPQLAAAAAPEAAVEGEGEGDGDGEGAAAELEAALSRALEEVCPAYAPLARRSVRRVGERGGGADLESAVAAAVFGAAARDARAAAEEEEHAVANGCAPSDAAAAVVLLQSRLGLQRSVSRAQLAQLLLDALPPLGAGGLRLAALRVAPGESGHIRATTLRRREQMAAEGRVACAQCGRYVMAHTGGLEWHLKTAHGVRVHAEAAAAAAAAATAMVPYALRERSLAAQAPLAPCDLARAQRDAGDAARLVAAGRVRALEPGLDACRSGDLARLRALVEAHGWAARSACDEHGSGPLLWAAGGGHLEVCRYLVESCGVDPLLPADARLARRGYSGRTALHWAARNGHVPVLRWLVACAGCPADARTADGTSALCWAAWQGHVPAARFLVAEARCDPHARNAFRCTPAHWAAQGGNVPMCEYLHALGVSFGELNSQDQGCLHKAAQRGHAHVCDWLLGPAVGLLAPGNPGGKLHCGGNKSEGARPSELARCGGHHQLARRLADAEEAWLASNAPCMDAAKHSQERCDEGQAALCSV
jgi:hypothetical protein